MRRSLLNKFILFLCKHQHTGWQTSDWTTDNLIGTLCNLCFSAFQNSLCFSRCTIAARSGLTSEFHISGICWLNKWYSEFIYQIEIYSDRCLSIDDNESTFLVRGAVWHVAKFEKNGFIFINSFFLVIAHGRNYFPNKKKKSIAFRLNEFR